MRAFYRLYAKGQRKTRWGDKTPGYAMKMRRIERILPEARFIHMIRDGRDVALSLERRGADLTMEQVARRWRHRINRTRRAAKQGRRTTPRSTTRTSSPTPRRSCARSASSSSSTSTRRCSRYHERAEERLQEIARPLEEEDEKRGLSAESRVEAHALTSEPPRADRVGMWRPEMSPEDLATFREHGGELLAELGYES